MATRCAPVAAQLLNAPCTGSGAVLQIGSGEPALTPLQWETTSRMAFLLVCFGVASFLATSLPGGGGAFCTTPLRCSSTFWMPMHMPLRPWLAPPLVSRQLQLQMLLILLHFFERLCLPASASEEDTLLDSLAKATAQSVLSRCPVLCGARNL